MLYVKEKIKRGKQNYFYFLAVIGFLFSITSCSSPQEERYVVVLSLDGFRYDYPELAKTPTLDSIARVGVRSTFRPSFPSNTFPNHYSMATGLHPDHHGIVNNSFYDPALGIYMSRDKEAIANPDFYEGEPIWNTAEKQGIRTATYYWIGSETPVQGLQPSICKPFDDTTPFVDRADSVIAWLQLPKEIRPHLIMWYIEEPDAIGHTSSPDSEEVISVVEKLDEVVNYFFAKARQLDIFDKIDFIVLSDHGMATVQPERIINLQEFLPRDSFEHVFEGVPALLYPKKGFEDSAYHTLSQIPDITVWKKDEVPAIYIYGTHPRIGDLIVLPSIGGYVQFRPTLALWTGGTHGYDNFTPEMQAIFYATGPSFKKGVELPPMANVNLYLIIARLLGIQPVQTDGNQQEIESLFSSSLKK